MTARRRTSHLCYLSSQNHLKFSCVTGAQDSILGLRLKLEAPRSLWGTPRYAVDGAEEEAESIERADEGASFRLGCFCFFWGLQGVF